MDALPEIARSLFAVDSIWSIVFRAAIWFGVALVIIVSVDSVQSERSMKSLKANLGFFFLFIIMSSVLVYTLFGYTAA